MLSIESRGFIIAGAIAYKLNAAFIPLRKPDKLPHETYSVSFDLEYGSTEMHIHKDALDGHQNLLIIDDLLATGGTAIAAIELVEKFDSKNIVGAGFIINLPDLDGDKKLKNLGIDTLLSALPQNPVARNEAWNHYEDSSSKLLVSLNLLQGFLRPGYSPWHVAALLSTPHII